MAAASVVATFALLAFDMVRSAEGGCYRLPLKEQALMTAFFLIAGAWLVRALLSGAKHLYVSALAFGGWAGLLLGTSTVPMGWGAPLIFRWPGIAWVWGFAFAGALWGSVPHRAVPRAVSRGSARWRRGVQATGPSVERR